MVDVAENSSILSWAPGSCNEQWERNSDLLQLVTNYTGRDVGPCRLDARSGPGVFCFFRLVGN